MNQRTGVPDSLQPASSRVRYGPCDHPNYRVHRFTEPIRTTDGDVVWKSACGQVAYPKERLYAVGTPLDAIRKKRCGNCFREERHG